MQIEERGLPVVPQTEGKQREVRLLLRSHSYLLVGPWAWDLHCEAVFCSDVLLTHPAEWEGTRAILHPEDVPMLSETIGKAIGPVSVLSFRIITTYGEMKTLRGTGITVEESEYNLSVASAALDAYLAGQVKAAREERESFGKRSSQLLESFTRAGTWWYNLSTGETWYSDAVFHLHGLLPQSLNSHLHTFHPFLHPDDRTAVLDALSTALARQVPLQVAYRLVLPDNSQKSVEQSFSWTFTEKGQTLLYGFFRDITENRTTEGQMVLLQAATDFQKQLLHFAEGAAGLAFWQLNVLTRKLHFSDNYYRIFGLKPQSPPASFGSFLHYIHPDDRSAYEAMLQQVRSAQAAPAIDFRVLLPDGKLRYVRQKGRSLVTGTEVMMVGTVQDITVQKGLEKKLAVLQEAMAVQNELQQQTETLAETAHWQWNLKTGDIHWSHSFYELMGQKPGAGQLTQKGLQQAIHPEDLNQFNEHLRLLLSDGKESNFSFRLISKGKVQHLRASFRQIAVHGQDYFIGAFQNRTADEETYRRFAGRMRLVELLSDVIPNLVLVTDEDHTVILWNRRFEDVFGQKKSHVIGQNFYDVLPQLKEKYTVQLLEKVLEGEKQELQNFQPPPPLRGYYNISLLPMRDEEGRVVGILHLLQDVTKEHQLHLALSGRLQLIEKLVEASVDRIIALDRDMNYLYWNQQAALHYGMGKEAVIGKNILEVFPRHQQLPSYARFREALRGATVHLPVGSKETEDYTETYLIPVLNEKGDADAVLWITHDLSTEYRLLEEQQRAEGQIREQSHYLQRITETVPDMLSIMELETGKFTFLNAETFTTHGFDAGEMMNKTREENSQIVHADDREVLTKYFQQFATASDDAIVTAEYRAKTKSGDWGFFRVRGRVFQRDSQSRVTHVINAIENITERKNAEQDLQTTKEFLQATLDTSLYIVQAFKAIRDEGGKIIDFAWLYTNKKWKEQYGGEMTGKRLLQENPAVLETGLFTRFIKVTETGVSQEHEHHYAHEQFNGWFHQTIVKMGDGFVLTTVDMTERKHAEQEILRLKDEVAQRTEDKYRILFNSIDQGFYRCEVIFDEANNPVDIRYLEENPAAVQVTRKSLVGKTIKQANPDNQGDLYQVCGDVVLTGESKRLQHYAVPDKKWFDFHISKVGKEESHEVVVVFRDITERKLAEKRMQELAATLEAQVAERTHDLQESMSFVAQITQTTPELITIHEAATTRILFTNHKEFWKTLYNNDETYQQAEEKRAIALTHPDDSEKMKTFLRERNDLPDGDIKEVELRMKGGKWVRIRSKVFRRDENGAALQIISFTSDITEAKIAEQEIQKNLAILQHTEDLADMGSWEFDFVTGSFTWSEGMYRLFGLPTGSPVSPETYLQYAVEAYRPVAKRIVKSLKKSHQDFEEIMRINTAAGERLLKIKGSAVHDESGNAQRMVGIDVDITAIQLAEARLQENKHLLEQTALASPDSITVYDLRKKQPLYLNHCLAEWVGRTNEELMAMGIDGRLQLIHPDDRLRLLHFNEKMKAAKDGALLTIEYRILGRDDTTLWIRNRAKVFQRDADGTVTQILSVLQDVTEAKAAERVLKSLNTSLEKKAQELAIANDEITSFAFVASHDLKEPLRKIATFSDWLLKKEPGLSPEGLAAVKKLYSSVERLEVLTSDILTLTKVHVSTAPLKAVDLNTTMDLVKQDLQEMLLQSNAILDISPLPTILGVANHFRHLFKNLVSNGIKFQHAGAVPKVTISAGKEASYLKVSIADNGIGIAPEYHKRIFEIFRRLHNRTDYEGTGMGLAICKKIMEKHGGKITVESKEDEGATFVCWFPLALIV